MCATEDQNQSSKSEQGATKSLQNDVQALQIAVKSLKTLVRVCIPVGLIVVLLALFVCLIGGKRFSPPVNYASISVTTVSGQVNQVVQPASTGSPVTVNVSCEGKAMADHPTQEIHIRPVVAPYIAMLSALTAVFIASVWGIVRVFRPDDY